MSKLLDYLNALDTDAATRAAHAVDAYGSATAFGLTHDESMALVQMDKFRVAAFLDIPFRDFDAVDIPETVFGLCEQIGSLA